MHVVGHAVFKAHLFMVLGLILHAVGRQDSRTLPACTPRSSIAGVASIALYQSTGWVYTPTWSTKKVLVDSSWDTGPAY